VTPRVSSSFILLLIIAFVTACGGGSSDTPPAKVTDVYAVGYEVNPSSGLEIATLWKNSQRTILGGGIYGSYATSVAVSANDVYVAGVEGSSTNDIARYWKNGVAIDLTDGTRSAYVNSIFVSGNDVYVAGGELAFGYSLGGYWKNGTQVLLTDDSTPAVPWSIRVFGPDVYVAGYAYKTVQIDPTHFVVNPVAVYWKNGEPVELTDGRNAAVAFSIFVAGSDVYVAGFACQTMEPDCAIATYWKNGVPVQLSDQTSTDATSIFVSGSDVYASGNVADSQALFWKNGTMTVLTNDQSAANQLVVSGKDVYIGGADWGSQGTFAQYWKNAVPVRLTDGKNYASVFAITVATR